MYLHPCMHMYMLTYQVLMPKMILGRPVERNHQLRLVLAVQLEDVPRRQVPLAQASAQRHLQPSSWPRSAKLHMYKHCYMLVTKCLVLRVLVYVVASALPAKLWVVRSIPPGYREDVFSRVFRPRMKFIPRYVVLYPGLKVYINKFQVGMYLHTYIHQ
jgi:hypothetical protein